ncbi:hypothetical protein NOS3756_57660 (plasmid) [Nostoc sp. NIES-3756]|uniref:hypothetical protein n=1 Tax=Nostoc sp. NIES-3756 TaxID=1751286 RepID=UPI0007227167|nr:hypothetical protein [Nostoc sp. NIES-3756]BAT56754.1 hypothetical protein NOS3756_57660 [Nostoc sp. NIES-3756]
MEARKSSTLEKIREINPGGISDNMMIARLSRVLKETPIQQPSLSIDTSAQESDPNRQQKIREELGQLLSKGSPEEDVQALKQQYLQQYLTKFGLEDVRPQQSQADNLITQLGRLKERQKSALSTANQPKNTVSSFVKQTFDKVVKTFENQQQSPDRKSFIRTVIDTIITRGKSLGEQQREYENDSYRASLQVEEQGQILNINRKQPQPDQENLAFKALKQGNGDFQVLRDNLSVQEAQDVVANNPQSQQSQQPPQPFKPRIPQKRTEKTQGPSLD